MNEQSSILIPSTMQRIRCFMSTEGSLKVKPWATVDETLDGFFGLLSRSAADDDFWKGIRKLLGDISADLKRRQAAAGKALDNEVLDTLRYDDLLAEIRKAVNGRPGGKGAFVGCLSGLSAKAVSLMFLLGGVAAAGCSDDSTGNLAADSESDAIVETDSDSNDPMDTASDTDSNDPTDTDFSNMSLAQIVEAVVEDEIQQEAIINCIDGLNDSWETGLEALFQSETDDEIVTQLGCLMIGNLCDNPDAAGEYSLETLLDNCAIAVYLGIRFE